MSTVTCPFCQHENSSGTRFCSECGSSIYLKICPSPECGKISHIDALVCETCGQPFPNKNPAQTETTKTEESAGHREHGNPVLAADKEKPRSSALPLVMMAIVAGGLPMLWINRAHLPTPKTWQSSTSDVAKTESIASTPAAPAPIVAPPPASVNSVQPSLPDKADPPSLVAPDETPSKPSKTEDTKKTDQTKRIAKTQSQKTSETPRPKESKTPPPPCTEATIALGLCNAKQQAK